MHLDRIDFQEAIVRLAVGKHPAPAPGCALAQPMTAPPADDGQRKALKLWDEAGPIAGTLAEQYLTRPKIEGGRGLTLPPDISPRVLRFHPRVWFSEKVSFGPAWHPCLLALYRNIVGPISFTPVRNTLGIRRDFPEHEPPDEPRAVMRTALTPDGRKIGRAALGSVAGTAIKLSDDADVTTGLVIGEGLETTLAGMVFGFAPAWALGTAGGIAKFPVLSGIEALTILAETDDSGAACPANEQAIRKCFARWSAAGRDVYRATSTVGGDANDALMADNERAEE